MAWGGLQNTIVYQTLYPVYLPNGSVNPDQVLVNNIIASEEYNVTSYDAYGNPINPKGVQPVLQSNGQCP